MSSISSSESEGGEAIQNNPQHSFDIYATYERLLQNEDVRPEVVFMYGNIPI
jgi:hypothetical protein